MGFGLVIILLYMQFIYFEIAVMLLYVTCSMFFEISHDKLENKAASVCRRNMPLYRHLK